SHFKTDTSARAKKVVRLENGYWSRVFIDVDTVARHRSCRNRKADRRNRRGKCKHLNFACGRYFDRNSGIIQKHFSKTTRQTRQEKDRFYRCKPVDAAVVD